MRKSALCFVVLFFMSSLSQAAVYTYELEGSLFFVDSSYSEFSSTDTWSAIFKMDDHTIPDFYEQGRAKYYGLSGEIYIAGQLVFDLSQNNFYETFINSGNDLFGGSYDYFDFNGDNLNGVPANPLTIAGHNITGFEVGIGGSLFDELSLQESLAINQAQNWGSEFNINIAGGDIVSGYVQSIEVHAMPVPATFPLLLSSIAALAFASRKRKV